MTADCPYASFVGDVPNGFFITNCVISVFGTIGCLLSLWSLYQCPNTIWVMKVQLGALFGSQLAVCLVALPVFSVLLKQIFTCFYEDPVNALVFVYAANSLLYIARFNYAATALSRLLAVRWPVFYKKMARVNVIVILEVIFFVYALIPFFVSLGSLNHDIDESFSLLKAYSIMHDTTICLPTIVSLIAYILMVYTMFRRKQQLGISKDANATTMDHVAYTIRLFTLIDLLLDLPLVIAIVIRVTEDISLILHSVYYFHFILDPFLFVGVNTHYREALAKRLRSCCRGRTAEEEEEDERSAQGCSQNACKRSLTFTKDYILADNGVTEVSHDSHIPSV